MTRTITEQLQQIGFSQYEAQAYVALLKNNPINGYVLAKESGIPRPNIYPVLQKLEERGAVLRMDEADGVRYVPTPPQEILNRLKQNYLQSLDSVSAELSEIASPPSMEQILNLRGYPALLREARTLLDLATESLLLGVWPEEAALLADPLEKALARGARITTLCLRGCLKPCPACRGSIFRYSIAAAGSRRWLVVVADGSELLAGEITPQGEALALRTRQKMLIQLAGGYIQNSIGLAALLENMETQGNETLDPQVRMKLEALQPLSSQDSWLDGMRKMIHNGGQNA